MDPAKLAGDEWILKVHMARAAAAHGQCAAAQRNVRVLQAMREGDISTCKELDQIFDTDALDIHAKGFSCLQFFPCLRVLGDEQAQLQL